MVDEARIGDMLSSDQSPDDQCRALVDLALAAGGNDDVTALIARYRIP
jgi:serine/threonine protein phosphatase PrpC